VEISRHSDTDHDAWLLSRPDSRTGRSSHWDCGLGASSVRTTAAALVRGGTEDTGGTVGETVGVTVVVGVVVGVTVGVGSEGDSVGETVGEMLAGEGGVSDGLPGGAAAEVVVVASATTVVSVPIIARITQPVPLPWRSILAPIVSAVYNPRRR
jgi:hypothetical protein